MATSTPITIVREDGRTTLTFDAVIRYARVRTISVTSHPVETGSTVSDHAQVQPDQLTITGIVSETPYASVASSGGADRTAQALAFLDGAAGELLTVVTAAFGTLRNMVLTRIPTEADNVRRLGFDLEFRQVVLATAGLVDIPPEQTSSSGLPDEQDVGDQPTDTSEDDPAQEEADTSLLLDLLTAVGAEP